MKGLKDLFVPYKLAKTAKDKGFDEFCLGYYSPNGTHVLGTDPAEICVKSPLYQQLVAWFIEKKIFISYDWQIDELANKIVWSFKIDFIWGYKDGSYNNIYNAIERVCDEYSDCIERSIEEAFKLI